ncbi:MAG: helix-turn-helix transcriptional regulator [Pseudomonadota bacterium]
MNIEEQRSAAHLNREIGRVLRVWRAEKNMTQADVARAIHISPQQFQKYETGVSRMELSRLFEICAVFGKSPSAVLGALQMDDPAIADISGTIANQTTSKLDIAQIVGDKALTEQADLSFQVSELVAAFLRVGDARERNVVLRMVRAAGRPEPMADQDG